MKLDIHVFAGLAEQFGGAIVQIEWEASTALTPRLLKQQLSRQYPQAASALEQAFVAINQSYADDDSVIQPGDEVAIIPPVSGGQPDMAELADTVEMAVITHAPISVEAVTAKVIHPNHGAALSFIGTTREWTHGQRTVLLEYEAYEPMAIKMMRQISEEIHARWDGTLCAITHRLGQVDIGEISVVIAVSAPHRDAAYEASRYAIERLKQIVPIWKKEVWEDGSTWKGHQQGPWNPLLDPAQPDAM
ncbi:molybdenum cofactor biosynthesis protein [Paenibacillus xerothermodurans]|uniref:Molybdopterin synthase catalytic subunit n=1 Tax=Paenibacillus xerothermodurans TaxID=1977292 RepID=A0A2W1NE89_PAEXE|nr:molybdenum cofactor biosynthesis protein MoaE [Paenibacillus xerothermodurans]PZE21441.1 molybdopterin converting factor [Paenibacillus xerothermodurans]